MKCLDKNPADRYESAAAFAEDLRRFLDDELIVTRPTTVVRTTKGTRRHPWRFVLQAALLAALIAGGLWLYDWEFHQRAHIEIFVGLANQEVPEVMFRAQRR